MGTHLNEPPDPPLPAAWWRCLDISERAPRSLCLDSVGIPSALGEKRLAEWRSQSPFHNGDLFSRRLAASTCSPEALAYLLEESSEALNARVQPPGWLKELGVALYRRPSYLPGAAPPVVDSINSALLIPFEPLIQEGCVKFESWVDQEFNGKDLSPFEARKIIDLFYPSLYKRIVVLAIRTMTLELNVARIKGLLTGDTAKERFSSFARHLEDPCVSRKLIEEYPVLLRLVSDAISQWRETSAELVLRLTKDWEEILAYFQPSDSAAVVQSVMAGLGDRHRRGRSVALLCFSSNFKLIYKPRSLSADGNFQHLLEWIGSRTADTTFKTIKVLDKTNYGWSEFIEKNPCKSKEELSRFYRRQGGYLALLYALGATDFHYENLIAVADHPVLIDLETLFTPRVPIQDSSLDHLDSAGALFSNSVLATSLLPRYTDLGAGMGADDASGLGAVPDRLSRLPELSLEERGTDEMRFVKRQIRLPEGKNRPQLENVDIRLSDFEVEIADGFKDVYNTIVGNLAEFSNEVETRFRNAPMRTVLRATRIYVKIFQSTIHPDALRDALDRAKMLDWLWNGVISAPCVERIVQFEIQDIAQGDVPYFFSTPSSYHLTTSSGELVPNFLKKSGFDIFHERLETLGSDDLERQLWIIRSTLVAPEMTSSDHLLRRPTKTLKTTSKKNSKWFLDIAIKAGERLDTLAFETADRVDWIGLKYKSNFGHFAVEPVDYSLFSGHAGIALFLGYLGMMANQPRFTELAAKSTRSMLSVVGAIPPANLLCGAFEGWSGVIYSLTHLGRLWNSPDLLDKAEDTALRLWPATEELPIADASFDIIGGLAGCIGALLSLHSIRPGREVLAIAHRCGEILVRTGTNMKKGIGWVNSQVAEEPLSGFSHGNAGVGWALMNLYKVTKEEIFRSTAIEAVSYEDTLFDQRVGNWASRQGLWGTGSASPSLLAWCHGAPGIVLSRVPFLSEFTDKGFQDRLDVAAATVLREGFEASQCFCHGDLGNLDCLLEFARARGDLELLDTVWVLGGQIGERVRNEGWQCGIPKSMETPGLMVGIAGIGYEFLRLAALDRVPSVLSLSAPC